MSWTLVFVRSLNQNPNFACLFLKVKNLIFFSLIPFGRNENNSLFFYFQGRNLKGFRPPAAVDPLPPPTATLPSSQRRGATEHPVQPTKSTSE